MARRIMPFLAVAMMVPALGTTAQAQTSLTEQQTTIGETKVVSVEEEARRWQLTPEEYNRHLLALEGPRGRLSDPDITPIEVLGIEAQTTGERERYARLWVEMIRRDTAKTLAFTRSVHDAWLDIAPDRALIDPILVQKLKLQNGRSSTATAVVPSRLIVFISLACEGCDADMRRLLGELEEGRHLGLDIYVLETAGDDERIQAWALAQNIPVDLVNDQTITLNIDRGELQTLADSMGITPSDLPVVVRRQEQSYDLVKLH